MTLFSAFRLGPLELQNRVVMAPMTRSRATGNVPNELMRTYYAQRANAGLIITEGAAPSPNGVGYARIPGAYSPAQLDGWRSVTGAVHSAGARIFLQLMHVGRIAHESNLPPGGRVMAPSPVQANGTMWTDQNGLMPFPLPNEMTALDIEIAKAEFVHAARGAIGAGFDGVELHSANGYLLEQFLHPHTNRRADAYGGSMDNRCRFVAEVAHATADAIGGERVGIRLSPFGTFNDLPEHDAVHAQYTALAPQLRRLAYVHIIRHVNPGFAATAAAIRTGFHGPIILNGGFDQDRAQAAIDAGEADLISFGRPYVSNPDLVFCMRDRAALARFDVATFYTPGPQGYVDYPTLS